LGVEFEDVAPTLGGDGFDYVAFGGGLEAADAAEFPKAGD
jgi:hypothetical protein